MTQTRGGWNNTKQAEEEIDIHTGKRDEWGLRINAIGWGEETSAKERCFQFKQTDTLQNLKRLLKTTREWEKKFHRQA